jgi:hypothetical protein
MRRPISSGEQKENFAVSASQSDLFDTVRLPGLAQAENIVTRDEEQALIRAIDAVELSPFRFHQWTGKRLTAAFGWSYDFETGRLAPSTPIPDWVLPLRERAGRFARLPAEELVQVLLILAPASAGIGIARCSSTSSASPSARRRPCAFAGDAAAASSAPPRTCRHGRSTILAARRGTSGSTASPRWR